jgi:hypothetical protein
MLEWRPLLINGSAIDGLPAALRVGGVLQSWDGTPYMHGQAAKGVGVDCIRFVCAVLNELYGEQRASIPRLPQDTAMHNPKGAFRVLREVLRIYPEHDEVIETGVIEPGDVIITAKPGCGPGHSIFVGPDKNVLWHSVEPMVCRVGIGEVGGGNPEFMPYRVYRMRDKEKWNG